MKHKQMETDSGKGKRRFRFGVWFTAGDLLVTADSLISPQI